MLTSSPFYHPITPHAYIPTTPSPLSPRSANIHGRPPPPHNPFHAPSSSPLMSDSTPDHPANKPQNENAHTSSNQSIFTFSSPPPASTVPFSKRPVRKAPSPKPNELRERRRGAFLKKVREEREEGRFEARGEDIMRLEFLRGRRAWEARLAEEAEGFVDEEPEEEMGEEGQRWESGLPESSGMVMSEPEMRMRGWVEEEVDEVARREEREMEALIESLPGEGAGAAPNEEQNLWSDDDDYDALFSEFMEQDGGGLQSGQPQQQQNQQQQDQRPSEPATQEGGEAMDTS